MTQKPHNPIGRSFGSPHGPRIKHENSLIRSFRNNRVSMTHAQYRTRQSGTLRSLHYLPQHTQHNHYKTELSSQTCSA
jgi:hypothetical protein